MLDNEIIDLREKIKEVIKEFEGKALDRNEQTKLYRRIKKATSPFIVEELSTVYRACMFCGFDTEYFESEKSDWKILVIFSNKQIFKQGYIDYIEKELEFKKEKMKKLEESVKYYEDYLQKLKND